MRNGDHLLAESIICIRRGKLLSAPLESVINDNQGPIKDRGSFELTSFQASTGTGRAPLETRPYIPQSLSTT